ncbi:MAG: NAD(P)/FAD-dependent oxidoreductase, partial [Candidatus Krumholzibacteriia bacterium]
PPCGAVTRVRSGEVFVVGGGPAGSYVSFALARQGFEVLLAEKRPEIGRPLRCGEAGGSRAALAHFLPLSDAWIAGPIDGARLFGPSGSCVERHMPGIGTQLHRDEFDQVLARQAVQAGVELRTGLQVDGVSGFGNGTRTVVGRDLGNDAASFQMQARLVIGADGVESLVGQWLGLRRPFPIGSVHSGLQYLLDNVPEGERYIDLYTGHGVAPGGYAWVFPKNGGTANVGLGVHVTPKLRRSARDYLDDFVQRRFPESRVLRVMAGGVSGARSLKSMVADGAALVGEAGHTNNPFSGGGIMNALESAEEAGIVLGAALRVGDVSARRLHEYQRRWHRRVGRTNDLFFKLRKLFFTFSDTEMDWAVEALRDVVRGLDRNDVDYTGIFRRALLEHPKLVLKASCMLW